MNYSIYFEKDEHRICQDLSFVFATEVCVCVCKVHDECECECVELTCSVDLLSAAGE